MFGQSHPQILLTRPLLQSQRFAAELASRFGNVVITISPLMQPVAIVAQPLQGAFDAVIFTSETGVAFGAALPDLPKRAFCVGDRTAEAARATGFDAVSAHGDWRGLAALIASQNTVQRVLYLHAAEAPQDLKNALIFAGFDTVSMPVYRQSPLDLTTQARYLFAADAPVIAPLFSARSARLLAAQLLKIPVHAPVFAAALSEQVAGSICFDVKKLQTAQQPDSARMMDAIARLL